MRSLCFLVPHADSAHGIVDDLRSRGVRDADIYVVANDATPLGDLPDAGSVEKSDFYPQLERGLAMGGTIGIIGGLIAVRVAGAVFGGGAVLLFGLIGAGVNRCWPRWPAPRFRTRGSRNSRRRSRPVTCSSWSTRRAIESPRSSKPSRPGIRRSRSTGSSRARPWSPVAERGRPRSTSVLQRKREVNIVKREKLVQVGEGASHMSLYDTPDHPRIVGEACAEFAKEYL